MVKVSIKIAAKKIQSIYELVAKFYNKLNLAREQPLVPLLAISIWLHLL